MAALPTVAEPNVTPLIDVMLVLLILFMVVTPVAQRGLDASLPAPSEPGPPRPVPRVPIVAVRADVLELDGQPLATVEALEAELRDRFAVAADRTVFVRADGDVSYGRAVSAMDAARAAGADRIGLLGASAVTSSPGATPDAPARP